MEVNISILAPRRVGMGVQGKWERKFDFIKLGEGIFST